MPSEKVIDLYRTIRTQPDHRAELNSATDTDDLVAKLAIIAREAGTDLPAEEIRSALPQLPEIIAQATEGDELNDEELEMVAAGTLMREKASDML